MVKIFEYHEEKGNPNNFQDRVIKYSSWDNFVRDIQEIDGTAHIDYPVVPRQTKIENVTISKNRIDYELTDRVHRMRVVAYAKLI